MTSNISSSSIISAVEGLLSSVTSVLSALLFVLVLVIFMGLDGAMFGARMHRVKAGHEPVLGALGQFAQATRRYFGVATVFGGIVAVLDGIGLVILGIPAAGLWALLAFITNYVPNVGFIIGLIPPALLGLVVGGPSKMIEVIVLYCVLNLIIQSVIQPKVVGDAVGLTTTMSFLSLIVWAFLLGPLGAILAIPASLLFKAVLLDVGPVRAMAAIVLRRRTRFLQEAEEAKAAKSKAEQKASRRRPDPPDPPLGFRSGPLLGHTSTVRHSPPIPLPISTTPITRSSTAITVALFCCSHALSRSNGSRILSAATR